MSSDDAKKAMVDSLLSGPDSNFKKFMIETLLDIKDNGCSQRCADKRSIHPAITATGISTLVIGVLEGIRSFLAAAGGK